MRTVSVPVSFHEDSLTRYVTVSCLLNHAITFIVESCEAMLSGADGVSPYMAMLIVRPSINNGQIMILFILI